MGGSTHQPWHWPLGRLKYHLIQLRSKAAVDDEEFELNQTCQSPNKDLNDTNTPLVLKLASCLLPQELAIRVKQRIQQYQESQQEWVTCVLLCAFAAIIVLFLNVVLTIIAASIAYSKAEDQELTSATLYRGKCSTSKNWMRGLHFLINVLSTIMLAASNYCMQCLSTPSRKAIDNAHFQQRWLDIGVPSMKDLSFVGRKRRMLWISLLVSSLPIHLIYNSAVFSALGTNEYPILLAPADFDFKDPPDHDPVFASCFEQNVAMNMQDFYSQNFSGDFEELDKQKCFHTHAVDFIAGQGTLILFTNDLTAHNESLRWVSMGNARYDYTKDPFKWMCPKRPEDCRDGPPNDFSVSPRPWSPPLLNATTPSNVTHNQDGGYFPSYSGDEYSDFRTLDSLLGHYLEEKDFQRYLDDPSHWRNSSWAKNIVIQTTGAICATNTGLDRNIGSFPTDELPVDRCLSQKVEEKCQLLFSLPICLTVIFCNVIKVVCMFATAYDDRKSIFLTVGGAVSSFLRNPDATTEGRCLLGKSDVTKGRQSWPNDLSAEKPTNLLNNKRWIRSVSALSWTTTITLCLLLLSISALLLHIGINAQKGETTFLSLWNLGFGTATSSTIVQFCSDSYDSKSCAQIIPMVLVANSPQILVSIAYFLYNSILTNMLLAAEYNDYAGQRKPLRVSWPKGFQRSTYYLSLPYRYSIPLLVTHAVLHWLVSQSLFFVEILPFDILGNPIAEYRLVTCGFSPIAIIFAIALGSVMVCIILGLGLRRFKTNMPLAVSCSMAISAACHPPPGDDHALKPIMWGEIPAAQLDHAKTNREIDCEEERLRPVSNLDMRDHGSDGEDTKSEPNRRQGNESQTQLLTKEDGSHGKNCTGYGHCSFSSFEIITPSSMRLYV